MGKLTDRQCQTARPDEGKKTGTFLSDGGGLYLRVLVKSKLWLWRFASLTGNGSRWFEIGEYPAISLSEARARAAALAVKRRAGVDPILEQDEAQAAAQAEAARAAAAEAARITVTVLFQRWAETDLIRHKDGGQHVKDMMRRHVLPHLGMLMVEDVRKGHVTVVTDKLLSMGKQRTAKVCLSLIRQMFRFAVDRDIIESDPTSSLRKAGIGGKDTERDRVLTEDEIRTLAAVLPGAGLKASTEKAIWLVLATGCRIGELLAARWADVDLANGIWRIPETKNGTPHTVFLSNFTIQYFQELKEELNGADKKWVFMNRDGSDHVCQKTVTKQIGDRQRPGMEPMRGRAKKELADTLVLVGGKWTPHDLRRTAATMMVALGVLPEVAERCLNHVETNRVKRIYQRHSYEKEMREAWQLLGERLELLTSNASNVVTLRCVA